MAVVVVVVVAVRKEKLHGRESERTYRQSFPEARVQDRKEGGRKNQGCHMAKFDPFISLYCARMEGGGRNPRKGRHNILQRSVAPEARMPNTNNLTIWQSPSGNRGKSDPHVFYRGPQLVLHTTTDSERGGGGKGATRHPSPLSF